MRKFKLLKDLPYIKAGSVFTETCECYESPVLKNLGRPVNMAKEIIENCSGWFEEIKSEKAGFIRDLFNKTKLWYDPNFRPEWINIYFQYNLSKDIRIAIPDFDALAKELYTEQELINFGTKVWEKCCDYNKVTKARPDGIVTRILKNNLFLEERIDF